LRALPFVVHVSVLERLSLLVVFERDVDSEEERLEEWVDEGDDESGVLVPDVGEDESGEEVLEVYVEVEDEEEREDCVRRRM